MSKQHDKLQEGFRLSEKYTITQFIGGGNAGDVYKVRHKDLQIDRAAKILKPRTQDPQLQMEFEKTFETEIGLLARVTHRNIVKIIDSGYVEIEEQSHRYYIMDFVRPPEGEKNPLTLKHVFHRLQDKEELVDVIVQLFTGISYLHDHELQIIHFDIKPSNIMAEPVTDWPGFEIKLADLGVAKSLRSDLFEVQETFVWGTPWYAPPYARELINLQKPISKEKIHDEWFPHYDIYCAGCTLAECLSSKRAVRQSVDDLLDSLKPEVTRFLQASEQDTLRRIIKRLTSDDPKTSYRTAADAREAFGKLSRSFAQPLGIPEVGVAGASHALTLPYQRVYLSDRAYRIINHPIFQRLNNLFQLTYIHLVYPGATHTRFLHSCATFELAKMYVTSLVRDPYFRYVMDADDYALFFAAALLHDIGHFPLAHAIEDFREEEATGLGSPYGVTSDNEQVSHFLHVRVPQEVGECPDLKASSCSLADLLAEWNVDPAAIVRVVTGMEPKGEAEQLVQSLLDGTIDVDKVSYLTYDSYYSGVSPGLGIDLTGLLDSLLAVPQKGSRMAQIGIHSKGISAAESVLGARYHMFARVYWHHTNRAFMSAIKYAFSRAFDWDSKYDFHAYREETLWMSDREALRIIANRFEECLPGITWPPDGDITWEKPHNPLLPLLRGERRLYKTLISVGLRPGSGDDARIYEWLSKVSLPLIEETRCDILRIVQPLADGHTLRDNDVYIDVPRVARERPGLSGVLVLNEESGDYDPLQSHSTIVEAIAANFLSLVKKCRVFITPELRNCLSTGGRWDVAKKEVYDHLKQLAK